MDVDEEVIRELETPEEYKEYLIELGAEPGHAEGAVDHLLSKTDEREDFDRSDLFPIMVLPDEIEVTEDTLQEMEERED